MWGGFSRPLALLILNRIRTINQAFARIAERIRAGTYIPRHPADTPRRHENRRPRGPSKLPQGFAWLVRLLPETAVYGSQLQFLFAEPEMAALIAAAPAAMRRPLRSLCRMLGVTPPNILARPAATRPEPQAPPAPARQTGGEAAGRPIPKPKRERKPPRVRYVFGLRDPPPFPNPP
jgi:hypothetical protein